MSKNVEPAHRIYKQKRHLFLDNFIGGVAWGLGSVIGATFVVALLGIPIARLQTAPLIGYYVNSVIEEVEKLQGK